MFSNRTNIKSWLLEVIFSALTTWVLQDYVCTNLNLKL